MIKYFKLFDLLNRKGMKKTDLLKVISSPTLAKLSKGETIKTDIIDKICLYLKCQPGDIMECITDHSIPSENGTILTSRFEYNENTDESENIIDIVTPK